MVHGEQRVRGNVTVNLNVLELDREACSGSDHDRSRFDLDVDVWEGDVVASHGQKDVED